MGNSSHLPSPSGLPLSGQVPPPKKKPSSTSQKIILFSAIFGTGKVCLFHPQPLPTKQKKIRRPNTYIDIDRTQKTLKVTPKSFRPNQHSNLKSTDGITLIEQSHKLTVTIKINSINKSLLNSGLYLFGENCHEVESFINPFVWKFCLDISYSEHGFVGTQQICANETNQPPR